VLDQVPFAIMSAESGMPALCDILRRVCASKGWGVDQLKGWFFTSSDLPDPRNPSDIRALGEYLRSREIKVLILDPAYLLLDVADQAGNLFAMGRELRPLGEKCREWGVTLQVLHHCKRGPTFGAERFRPAELSDIAWSGFAEFSAQWILLSRRAAYDPETGHHALWLNNGGRAGHTGLFGLDVHEGRRSDPGGRVWQVEVRPASEIRAATDANHDQQKESRADLAKEKTILKRLPQVAQVLLGLSGPESTTRIAGLAGLSNGNTLPALARLQSLGVVAPHKFTKGGQTVDGWKMMDRERADRVGQGRTNELVRGTEGGPDNGAPKRAPVALTLPLTDRGRTEDRENCPGSDWEDFE
jgi:hypothetical protein